MLLVVLIKPAARIADSRKTCLCTTSLAKIKTQKEELRSGCASYENTDQVSLLRAHLLRSAHFDVTWFTTNLEIATSPGMKRTCSYTSDVAGVPVPSTEELSDRKRRQVLEYIYDDLYLYTAVYWISV